MALLTKKSIYGLIAIYELYKKRGDTPTQLKDIAKTTGISKNFLEQIFISLKRANLIYSIRGPMGGYGLDKKDGEILIGDVITALDGDICTTKEKVQNQIFNHFFNSCDIEINTIFNKPFSYILDIEKKLTKHVNYDI